MRDGNSSEDVGEIIFHDGLSVGRVIGCDWIAKGVCKYARGVEGGGIMMVVVA